MVHSLRVGAEIFFHGCGLLLACGEDGKGQNVPDAVGQRKLDHVAAVVQGFVGGFYEGVPLHSFDDGNDVNLRLAADGKGNSAFNGVAVVNAFFCDFVALLAFFDVFGFHKLSKTLSVVEVVDAVVDEDKLRKLLEADSRGKAPKDKKNKELDIKLLVDEPKSFQYVSLQTLLVNIFVPRRIECRRDTAAHI